MVDKVPTLLEWLTAAGGLSGFAALGWTAWQEVRGRRSMAMDRISIEMRRVRDQSVVAYVWFNPPEHYVQYQVWVKLQRPKQANLALAKDVMEGTVEGALSNATYDPKIRLMRIRMRPPASEQQQDRAGWSMGRVGIVARKSLAVATLRVTIKEPNTGRRLIQREFVMTEF